MIRPAILAAGVIAAGTMAASAETTFIGTIKILAATAQCQGHHAGDVANSHYHPKTVTGTAQSGGTDGITFVYNYNGSGYEANSNGGLFSTTATFIAVLSTGLGWGGAYTNPPPNQNSFIANFKHSPAALTSTTPAVTVTGQIKRPDNDPGGLACIINFIGVYVKDNGS